MKPHASIAVTFASALVEGDFTRARSFLAPSLRKQFTVAALRKEFFGMFRSYATGKPQKARFNEEFCWEEWPAKRPGDLARIYVGILGEDFVEAVTVTVADADGEPLIREIEWGRP